MIETIRTRVLAGALGLFVAAAAVAGEPVKSKPFQGVKANKGSVMLAQDGAKWTLTLSDDFVVPDAPAPHWQVVDGRGNAFQLQRLVAKDNKFHKTIELPMQVVDLVKVQIWCSFAESLLGEAGFEKVMQLQPMPEMCETARTGMFRGVKANKGFATLGTLGDQRVLVLSEEFVVPDTPAPQWQLVDSEGRVFLCNRLVLKDGRMNRMIAVPAYVKDVARVQIWCSFAETLLGEASFGAGS